MSSTTSSTDDELAESSSSAESDHLDTRVVRDRVIDSGGDLYLLVGRLTGEDLGRFLVSRHVLGLASPIWAAMLDPSTNWAETKLKEIELPEDCPWAMGVILRLAHLDSIPDMNMMLETTWYQVTVLCDKYDTTRLLKPFMENLPGLRDSSSHLLDLEKLLFVTWTFHLPGFSEHAYRLLETAHYDDSGRLVDENSRVPMAGTPLSATVTYDILRILHNTQSTMLHLMSSTMEELQCLESCDSIDSSEECVDMAYGSLVRGLWVLFDAQLPTAAEDCTKSLKEISRYVAEDLKINTLYNLVGYSRRRDHIGCGERLATLKRRVKYQMTRMKEKIDGLYRDHSNL